MLILTRRNNESIIIGEGDDKIVIRILSTRGRQVQIGIDAPKHIAVHREEIFDRIKDDEKTAVNEI